MRFARGGICLSPRSSNVKFYRTSVAFHALWRVIAALIAGPILMLIEFRIAVIAPWRWLFVAVTSPAIIVQRWLVELGAVKPQTGGHMPDFGFVIGFNLVVNILVVLILLFCYPNLSARFFTPRKEQA